jgi:hypothetical protein
VTSVFQFCLRYRFAASTALLQKMRRAGFTDSLSAEVGAVAGYCAEHSDECGSTAIIIDCRKRQRRQGKCNMYERLSQHISAINSEIL